MENEITVEVDVSLEKLKEILNKNSFKITREYDINDIYMVNKDLKIDINNINEILNNCILLRNIKLKNETRKFITYKHKAYNEKNEIIKREDTYCSIISIDEAFLLFQKIGYKKLIEIKDHLIVYKNNFLEFAVQLVNNKHIYIEIEQRNNKSINELKKEFFKTKYSY